MEKKIILITGASDGIGKHAAMMLSKQGHQIIIHGRKKQKTESVCKEIQQETGNNKIDYVIADLLKLSDVKKMAEELKQKYDHLDVVINNAGAFFGKNRELTEEGFEKTITLNLFAPFLLIHLLLNLLTKSKSARIINVSSAMHRRGGKPQFDDFQFEKNFKTDKAYGLSKLYLIWITRHFAKVFKNQGLNHITINACHPGAVATKFGQDVDKGFLFNLIFKTALLFMSKPESGAKSIVYLATSEDVKEVTGEFFDNKEKLEKPDETYYSEENQQKVWDYCLQIATPYLN